MIGRRTRWPVVVLMCLAAACGGSPGTATSTQGTVGGTVVSTADGTAHLSIPAGTIDPGTEVTIEQLAAPDAPDGSAALAFDLQPSGLQFAEPATLSVTIPYDRNAIPMGFVGVGDAVDQGTAVPATFTVADGQLTVEAQIEHFSVATLRFWWFAFPVETDCPAELAIGGTCTVEIRFIDDYSGIDSDFTGIAPYSIVESTHGRGVLRCDAVTDGPVDAVEVYAGMPGETVALATAMADDPRVQWILEFTAESYFTYRQACSEAPSEPGTDPTGDQFDGDTSKPVGAGEGEPGSDITRVSHHVENGVHVFTIEVAGDGQALAESATTNWYDVIVEALDGTPWGANATFFGGTPQDRGVRTGPNGPDRERVDDATVTLTWTGPSTLEMRVDTGGTELAVDTFSVTVISRVGDDTTRYDDAEGVGG